MSISMTMIHLAFAVLLVTHVFWAVSLAKKRQVWTSMGLIWLVDTIALFVLIVAHLSDMQKKK